MEELNSFAATLFGDDYLWKLFIAITTIMMTVSAVVGAFYARLSWKKTPVMGDETQFSDSSAEIENRLTKPIKKSYVNIGYYNYEPIITSPDRAEFGIWNAVGDLLEQGLTVALKYEHYGMGDLAESMTDTPEIVLGLFKTERRMDFFQFTAPLHRIGLQGICKTDARLVSPEQLLAGEFKVVVQRGEVGWEYAISELQHLHKKGGVSVVDNQDLQYALRTVQAGIDDVALVDEVNCSKFLCSENGKGYRPAFEGPLQIFDVCAAVSHYSRFDVVEISNAILKIRNTPRFLKLEEELLENHKSIIRRSGLTG